MLAFTATQIDARPVRPLECAPVQANAHVRTGAFAFLSPLYKPVLTFLASPYCLNREQELHCSTLLSALLTYIVAGGSGFLLSQITCDIISFTEEY